MIAPLRAVPASDYELGPELARGRTGQILQAHDHRHDRPVAIKRPLHGDVTHLERFVREARMAARLEHPGIIPVYESGLFPDGRPFFAMKHVEGRRLGEVVGSTRTFAERLALLPRLIAVADALGYAHERGIVHRDLGPKNVLVGAHGETLIMDWGLARDVGVPTDGPDDEPADPRGDVQSLGALLYFTLAGRSPVDGPAGPPPLIAVEPSTPPDLAAIVARAMARDPQDRYASAGELAADLKRFATGGLVSAREYSIAALARRWARRRLGAVVVGGAALAAVLLVGVVSFVRVARDRDAALAAEQRARTLSQSGAHMIGFLLDRLYPRLEAIGRLGALSGLGGQVQAYYGALAEGTPLDAGTLSQRAGALALLGDVERGQGNGQQAESLYRASLAMVEEQRSRFGDDAGLRERRERLESRLRTVAGP
jgi:eukaryotic-like serine/threonine-protein kinase